jgi:uncharacterized membrane-anchored protein
MESKHLNKVAQITLMFGVMKNIARALGEPLGDFISGTLNLSCTIGMLITLAFSF